FSLICSFRLVAKFNFEKQWVFIRLIIKKMKKIINNTSRWVFNGLCILIGLYPIIYFLIDRRFGLLSSKSQELLSHQMWNFGFYGHIVLGGIALLIGWTQFSSNLRRKRKGLHRV